MKKEITFTCTLGVFIFEGIVKLGHAKLLRDTIMGRYLNPKQGEKQLRTEEDVHKFVETLTPQLSSIPFDLSIRR